MTLGRAGARALATLLCAALALASVPTRAWAAPLAPPADLGSFFDGSRPGAAPAPVAAVAPSPATEAPPAHAPAEAKASGASVPPPAVAAAEQPRCRDASTWKERVTCVGRKLTRSVKEGAAMGSLMYATTLGLLYGAQALGYAFHPSYAGAQGSLAAPVAGLVTAAVLAPLWEEFVFRHLAFGKLKDAVGGGWIPGLVATALNTAIFVLLHETADPVMIAIRAVGNLMLLHAYQHEGLGASVLAHAVFNFSLLAPAALAALGILPVGVATAIVLALNLAVAAVKAGGGLHAAVDWLRRKLARA